MINLCFVVTRKALSYYNKFWAKWEAKKISVSCGCSNTNLPLLYGKGGWVPRSKFPEEQTVCTSFLTHMLAFLAHKFKYSSSQPHRHMTCVSPAAFFPVTFYCSLREGEAGRGRQPPLQRTQFYQMRKRWRRRNAFVLFRCWECFAHLALITKLVEWLQQQGRHKHSWKTFLP